MLWTGLGHFSADCRRRRATDQDYDLRPSEFDALSGGESARDVGKADRCVLHEFAMSKGRGEMLRLEEACRGEERKREAPKARNAGCKESCQ